jgi:TonB family protein
MKKKRATFFALCMAFVFLLGCATTQKRYTPAKVASTQALEYPLSAQLDKIEGEVLVGVFVNAEGFPDEVKLLESSGHAVLDSAAQKFAETLTFNPAIVDDKTISSWTKLVLRYKLTEVPFEKNKWLEDVRLYQKKITAAQDSSEILSFQRKLYTRYIGLATYVEQFDNIDINKTITKVVTSESRKHWADFYDVIAVPFLPYDDFLIRYPNSPLNQNIKEDLIRLLMDAEANIRIQILQENNNPQLPKLLNDIEQRLDELQSDIYKGTKLRPPR